MKEALKLCVAELREARGEVEEVMHNCAAALAGTEMGSRYAAQYRQQLARIDAAVAAAEAALALPEPEPVAWCVERVAPGMRDNGARIGPWWRRADAEAWADDAHKVVALYAGSAPKQSASPFAPCGRGTGTCGRGARACGREGCEIDVVPADQLPKSRPLDWSAPVVAGTAQLAAVTAERDQPCDVANEPNLWRCTVCGRIGTVGRCCGEETREPVRAPNAI